MRSGLGWPLPVAVTLGYAVALSVNYLLNRVLNFRSHAPLGPESLRYAGAVAVNFGVVLLGVTTGLAALGVPVPGRPGSRRVPARGSSCTARCAGSCSRSYAATRPAMMRSVRLSADELDRLVRRLRAAGCVFAEEEAGLLAEAATSAEELETLTARRAAGEPLEPLLGWVEFCGLRLAVAPGVFVPRQRTALLVDEVVALVRPGSVVVDLGCGVGAIAAAVLARVPGVEVYAVDVDPAAVTCARRNLPPERVFEGDLYAALPTGLRGEVDVVAANAPYVPTDAIALMPREARDHEHRVALDGGADGLAVQRRVIAEAPAWLRPGGHVLVETGRSQLDGTSAALRAAGFAVVVADDDESGGLVARGTTYPNGGMEGQSGQP